jgi:hypothetical protein
MWPPRQFFCRPSTLNTWGGAFRQNRYDTVAAFACSRRFGSLLATALATKTGNEFTSMNGEGVGFYRPPFMMAVAAQGLIGLFLVGS